MSTIYGKLEDTKGNIWNWYASKDENIFNMNPPFIDKLDEFLNLLRDLLRNNKPLVIVESMEHRKSIEKICEVLDKSLGISRNSSNSPHRYEFSNQNISLLLVELESQ